ncbi:hypothetical protein C0992_012009 [Termitomyces sp. T32_za158]|nr:hypothetical protein C0992_012009 [Termitomyces sp. T32_za158]
MVQLLRRLHLFTALLSFFTVIVYATQKLPIARSKEPILRGDSRRGFHAPFVSQNHQVYDEGLFTPFEDLSALSQKEYVLLNHPAFPAHSVRIKKTKFCDEGINSYTGYIDIEARHLFFYFFESRNDPDKDDVIFWTTGGESEKKFLERRLIQL